MEIIPDGENFIVTATVNDTWQLKWWIQSQVSQAEVLEPLSLRETIRDNFREALTAYD
jgi:predicted DNA-binding transcriptional regulator YafY